MGGTDLIIIFHGSWWGTDIRPVDPVNVKDTLFWLVSTLPLVLDK